MCVCVWCLQYSSKSSQSCKWCICCCLRSSSDEATTSSAPATLFTMKARRKKALAILSLPRVEPLGGLILENCIVSCNSDPNAYEKRAWLRRRERWKRDWGIALAYAHHAPELSILCNQTNYTQKFTQLSSYAAAFSSHSLSAPPQTEWCQLHKG